MSVAFSVVHALGSLLFKLKEIKFNHASLWQAVILHVRLIDL